MDETSKQNSRFDRKDSRQIFWNAFGLFLISTLVYSRALWCDFVLWDDPYYVLRNQMVRSGISWKSLAHACTTFECANWHPLTWMSLMLDYQLFGLKPWGFHLTNILLHGLNSALLFVWLAMLSIRTHKLGIGHAWIVAAVFAVHPVHVESVAWITERKDVLATLFGLFSLIAYDRWILSRLTAWNIMCFVCFALSLSAKPLFVTLPCVLLLVDYWPAGRLFQNVEPLLNPSSLAFQESSGRVFVRRIFEKIPLILLSACSCVITFWAQSHGGAVQSLSKLPFANRIPNAIVNYGSYLRLMIWPTRLSAFYPLSRSQWTDFEVIFLLVAFILFTSSAIVLRGRFPAIAMGWFWFLGTLVPVIGLIQVGSQAIADRYLYVPIVGATIAIVVIVSALLDQVRIIPVVRKVGVFCILFVMSLRTWHQIETWQNTESLARHSLEISPNSWNAHLLCGLAHFAAGRKSEAEAEYELTLKIYPEASNARTRLGNLKADKGQLKAALEQFQIGLELRPNDGLMRCHYANVLIRNGQLDDALVQYQLALPKSLDDFEFFRDYGRALILAGQPDLAIHRLERAVQLAPSDLTCRLRLANGVLKSQISTSTQKSNAERFVETCAKITKSAEALLILADWKLQNRADVAGREYWEAAMASAKREGRDDLLKQGQELISKVQIERN
jgi:Tfp pilus assembly protein PilF